MAFTFVTLPAYPTVPAVSGVPPLARRAGATAALPTLLVSDIGVSAAYQQSAQWGLFNSDGSPAIVADSCIALDFRKEYRVADFPLEQGEFASYNKVAVPFEPRLVFSRGGGIAERSAFLAQIDAAIASLTLYQVITPDVTYPNVNVTHYTYRRSSQGGVSLLQVEVWCQEIRLVANGGLTNTLNPNSQGAASSGTVTPQTPSASQNKAYQDSTNSATGLASTSAFA